MRIVDRYLAARWLKPFVSALTIFLVLFLLIDFFGLMDKILQHDPPVGTILEYLVYRTGYAIFFLSPMALLVGGFWMTYGLRHNNEWTICQLTGTAPTEILRGPLAGLALVTVLLIVANCFLMPEVARRVERLDDYTLKNRRKDPPVYRNVHTNLPDGRTIKIGRFDPKKALIRDITISKKTETKINLRLDAPRGHYNSKTGWVLRNVNVRRIKPSGEVITSREKRKIIPLAPPSVLATVMKLDPRRNDVNPVEYSLRDLYTSINYRDKRSMNATTERILLHWKFGFPLTNFILGLFGLIVGLRTNLGRAGGVGVCLLFGLSYWIVFSLSISWGKITGPLMTDLRILPLSFVYAPALLGLAAAYAVWRFFSEQL